MSNNQKYLIKSYFNSLVKEFIKDQKHEIEIIFQDFLDSRVKGQTQRRKSKRIDEEGEIFKEYSYIIQFLASDYDNEEDLRSVVVHEFTHLYLFVTYGNHKHGRVFYSEMYRFEDWLNENQGLTPRSEESKKHDKDQEIDLYEELEDLEKMYKKRQKLRQELEKSKKELRKKCNYCQQKSSDGTYYYHPYGENDKLYCHCCWEEIVRQHTEKCDECANKLGNSYFYNKKTLDSKKFCSSNCYSSYYWQRQETTVQTKEKKWLESETTTDYPAHQGKGFSGHFSRHWFTYFLSLLVIGIVVAVFSKNKNKEK